MKTTTRVLVRPEVGEPLRKITKVSPYSGGGFAVMMPYHAARQGHLLKMPVDYNRIGPFSVPHDGLTHYGASDRVKLSYHGDGFVQFSGENSGKITSGRDHATGEAKGLGLMSSPLTDPIRTGPTFALTAWGLADFDEAPSRGSGDLVFESEDLYFRGCTPETASGVLVECFVLPNRFWAGIRQRGERYVLNLAHHHFEGTGTVLEWQVVPLPDQPAFLAFCASRVKLDFSAPSGFNFNGPGFRRPDGTGEVLMAMYPPPTRRPLEHSLDRA